MDVATSGSTIEVGVRELKNNLSRYLKRISEGAEVIVTDHGRPVARLSGMGVSTEKLAALIADGVVQPPTQRSRQRPARRTKADGSVSGLVGEHRR